MNYLDFTTEQQEQISNAIFNVAFGRGGVVPSIDLPNKDYICFILNNLDKGINKLEEQASGIKNKSSKKYYDVMNALMRAKLHRSNMNEILQTL